MIGKWLTRRPYRAMVEKQVGKFWVGYVIIGTIQVPTFWDLDYNSTNRDLDLHKNGNGTTKDIWES